MSEDPLVAQAEITREISSALTPSLIVAGTTVAAGLAAFRFGPEDYQWAYALLLLGGPILAALQIAYFTLTEPDRLHSEKFLEKKLLISKLKPQIGDAETVVELQSEEKPIPNPKALEDGSV